MRPINKPLNPHFSSGPCAKRPGYDVTQLDVSTLGRSHRSSIGKAALQTAINKTRRILNIPADYHIGIVPGSDTGAMEMAMWSLLGPKPVDVCYWESFGKGWLTDIQKELKLEEVNPITAAYGELPDLSATNSDNDIVFTWNGTTSGVKVPNADWISDERAGLTVCDATSAVFAMPIQWNKLDVTTFSWQKVLGGEGGHGMIILSPAAVARLESHTPSWPMPKIFKLANERQLIKGIFSGATINTPSMLCVADYIDALNWIDSIGGLEEAISRSEKNLSVLNNFVNEHDWISFLAKEESSRSSTSVCLQVSLSSEQLKKLMVLLEDEHVAYDIGSYRDAPNGLRIWCGATVETQNIELLMPWLNWAYDQVTK